MPGCGSAAGRVLRIASLALVSVSCMAHAGGPTASWPTQACLETATHAMKVPAVLVLGIMQVEGGKPGQRVYNTNGSYDMGPMQVNSWWLPRLAPLGITARRLTDDGCLNLTVGTAILASALKEAHGDIALAVGWYHSHTPALAGAYKDKVRRAIEGFARQARNH